MDIFIWVDLSQVRNYIVGYYLFSSMACFLKELVIVTNLIAKRVGYFAYRKVIKHSEATRKDK